MTQLEPLKPHQLVAERLKQLRKARGWSAQKLADALVAAGVPWDRSVVAKFENGRRATLTLEEVYALAYVLEVAPVNLMTATDLGGPPVEVVPGLAVSSEDAREWIRGRKPVGDQDVDTYFSKIAGNDFGFIYSALKQARERIEAGERDGER